MLINCPECQKEVSDKAEKCIHCGYPLTMDYHYDIILLSTGENRISVYKKIMSINGLALKEAVDVENKLPYVVAEGIDGEKAQRISKELREIGAKVEVQKY